MPENGCSGGINYEGAPGKFWGDTNILYPSVKLIEVYTKKDAVLELRLWGFPGSPAVKTLPFNPGCEGSTPERLKHSTEARLHQIQ